MFSELRQTYTESHSKEVSDSGFGFCYVWFQRQGLSTLGSLLPTPIMLCLGSKVCVRSHLENHLQWVSGSVGNLGIVHCPG